MTYTPLLQWTGHPLADAGVASLLAIAGKSEPEELTPDDLTDAAALMERLYFSDVMSNYLTCVFPNSEYVQPGSGEAKKVKKKEYANDVLFAFRSKNLIPGARCAFSGQPATHLINRVHMPLITGKDVLNFFPNGDGGLCIAGPLLTALQALPLGGRRCEGRLLIVHADDPALTLAFAGLYWVDNQRLINLATSNSLPLTKGVDVSLSREASSEGKYPDAKSPQTLLLDDLQSIVRLRGSRRSTSVTAYWLSNSGQGPKIDIFHVPSSGVDFLARVNADPYRAHWLALLNEGWQSNSPSKKPISAPALTGPGRTRNSVLNDILAIFESGNIDISAAAKFIRFQLLKPQLAKSDARAWSATRSWDLTNFFLDKLLGMTQERITRIREFADRLAGFISASNDHTLLSDILYGDKEWQIRAALVKAQRKSRKSELLFGLDDYVTVFLAEDGMGRESWGLIRDLIVIRLVESLHTAGYFASADALEPPQSAEDAV